jgi:nitrate reductase delta subunit
MTQCPAEMLRLLSVLLDYPDDALLGRLDEIGDIAGRLPSGEIKNAVEIFLAYLKSHAPLRLQENYTAAFEMHPAGTLNLTWHVFGDNEKRAAALVRLKQVYGRAGWERTGAELPDYLPLMLEFLSICEQPEGAAAVWRHMQGLAPLAAHLEKTAPAYAALLQPLARMAAGYDHPGRNGNLA